MFTHLDVSGIHLYVQSWCSFSHGEGSKWLQLVDLQCKTIRGCLNALLHYTSPVQCCDILLNRTVTDTVTITTITALFAISYEAASELCRVLNLTLAQSRVLLTRLKSRGILIEEESGYYLNQLVYRQVLRLLKRRNIIHWSWKNYLHISCFWSSAWVLLLWVLRIR